MLINSKEKNKAGKILVWSVALLFILILVKVFVPFEGYLDNNSANHTNLEALEVPSIIRSNLNTEDILGSNKNRIYHRDNLSLYLNNELGTPTIMMVYTDSITELEKNGRFLAFLYLKDPTEWRKMNKNWDHILLTKESLIPVTKELNNRKYYIFKFRLEHPYFDISNLRELEFVRHTKQLGRFETIKFNPEDQDYIYPVHNNLGKLKISLKLSDLQKITKKRNIALKSGILITNDDDFVKARIGIKGKENIKSSIRLKGDWTDHLEHPTKWSYRIVPEGEETIFGMRKFSIQHPKSRNYIWEWLFNKVVKDNDLIGLRYDFVNVDLLVSDKDAIIPMGIMALEESFDKILIENNKRREGLILGFDESGMWNERKQVRDLLLDYPADVDLPKPIELPVKVYNENKVLSSPVLSKQFKVAKNLIFGLRNGKLKLSEAFDVDKLTFYIALSNLFGGLHGLHIENLRIYYNPVTNKLEPISFDSNSGNKLNLLRDYPIGIYDELYKEKLIENYEKVSSAEFINSFVKRYIDELNDLSLNMSGEFNDAAVDLSILQHNANLIKKKIFPHTIISSSLISMDETNMKIEIINISEFPVVIDGLVLKNGKLLNKNEQKLIINPNDTINYNFRLKTSFQNAFVSKKNKEGGFRYPKDLQKIRLSHHVIGSKTEKYNIVHAYTSLLEQEVIDDTKFTGNIEGFEFISVNEDERIILFKSGEFILDRILYIPSDYLVTIEEGFKLNFKNNASILSHSPIHSIGTKKNPVHFFSEDNTGGGIFVSSGSKKSILLNTHFTNLSIPKLEYWELSGSVNFNETTVEISNCVFERNRSEDALNIIKSKFTIDSTNFINTFSDSFDGDFVEGSITNSTFNNSGNDGIDISGSTINIDNITINNPSDKGLSAGEGSIINGSNITIRGGEIGVVSKDLSRINLTGISIENTRLAIACFQKKSEFGPAIVDLKEVRFLGNELAHLIEQTSELIIDNVSIKDKTEGVIDKMYGKEYGKSSK